MRKIENFKLTVLSEKELSIIKGGSTSQTTDNKGSDGGDVIEKDPPIYIKE